MPAISGLLPAVHEGSEGGRLEDPGVETFVVPEPGEVEADGAGGGLVAMSCELEEGIGSAAESFFVFGMPWQGRGECEESDCGFLDGGWAIGLASA